MTLILSSFVRRYLCMFAQNIDKMMIAEFSFIFADSKTYLGNYCKESIAILLHSVFLLILQFFFHKVLVLRLA